MQESAILGFAGNRVGLPSERQTVIMRSEVNIWFDSARVHGIVQMVDERLL
jgi:hypothetical protein